VQTGIVVPEMSDSKIIKLEDTATPTTEGELEGAEESLVMRKLLVSMQISEPLMDLLRRKNLLLYSSGFAVAKLIVFCLLLLTIFCFSM
jgi:hypothetical protein